jgi:hypothetical protein
MVSEIVINFLILIRLFPPQDDPDYKNTNTFLLVLTA